MPRLLIVAAAVLFSTGGAAIKSCGLAPWQVACFRSGIAALALLALLPESRRCWNPKTLVVGLAYAATMILFVLANRLTTAANTIFLQSTAPLYVLALAPILLHERIRRRELVVMAVLAVGLALFFVGYEAPVATAPDPVSGNVLAACAGLAWGLTLLGLRWTGSAGIALAAVAAGNLIACAAALPMALPVHAGGFEDWALVAYLGVIQIGLAYVCLTRGMRHVTAFSASLLLLVEPTLNPVWAWLVHNERPTPWSLSAGVLILAGTCLTPADEDVKKTARFGAM